MTETATAYIQIEKITPDRQETVFVDGYAWETDTLTLEAYQETKKRFEVPLEHAAYLVDLFSEQDEMTDTFPIAELGYRTLTQSHLSQNR